MGKSEWQGPLLQTSGTTIPTLVSVSDLHKSFTPRHILRGVSFEVQAGEVVGLLGLNGAGKTTLIKLLAGLLSSEQGYIHLLDQPLSRQLVRESISLMKEGQTTFFEYMNPRQNLHYYGNMMGVKQLSHRIEEILAQTDLVKVAHQPLLYLSFGMRRRVGLALAYLKGAQVLLLDEPSAGLDVKSIGMLKKYFKSYVEQGNAILLTGHEMGFLESVCDRILILHQGHLVAQGTISELIEAFSIRQWAEVWLEGEPEIGEVLEAQDNLKRIRLPLEDIAKLSPLRIHQVRLETSPLEQILNEVANVEG
jgi:ABC-type multidrug transport system ATPase subunit